VAFTYGFGIPIIFIYLMAPLMILAILDRVLLVYWFKPVVMQSDMIPRLFCDILKYAPAIYLLTASVTVYFCNLMWSNPNEGIDFVT
jgi:hypothetical protein